MVVSGPGTKKFRQPVIGVRIIRAPTEPGHLMFVSVNEGLRRFGFLRIQFNLYSQIILDLALTELGNGRVLTTVAIRVNNLRQFSNVGEPSLSQQLFGLGRIEVI